MRFLGLYDEIELSEKFSEKEEGMVGNFAAPSFSPTYSYGICVNNFSTRGYMQER